jgi:hypothetical protein
LFLLALSKDEVADVHLVFVGVRRVLSGVLTGRTVSHLVESILDNKADEDHAEQRGKNGYDGIFTIDTNTTLAFVLIALVDLAVGRVAWRDNLLLVAIGGDDSVADEALDLFFLLCPSIITGLLRFFDRLLSWRLAIATDDCWSLGSGIAGNGLLRVDDRCSEV